ncbi:hypothetical protein RJ639_001654 [Escallonia herrerae]|uniref:DUF659 domain-containing protein n=1 Tax=Escallonia herrerae TaxID=1293975 RepID=A0AA89BNW6_9ASTE|nr:hypothetical protein RJ639_001654 [Escallonia herrerae]
MANAIAAFGRGYVPPSADKLWDSFLSKEKARIERSMALIKESWPHTVCTILRVNRQGGTLGSLAVNILVSSPRGLMFLKAVDNSVGAMGALSDAIKEVGPSNVLQVVSYVGPSTESFEDFVLAKFPHAFWSPSTLDSVHMLMEDIAEMDLMKTIVSSAKEIEQCIHRSSLSIFTEIVKQSSNQLAAKLAPSYCIVKKIFELKEALQELVVSEEWKQWKHTSGEVINIEAPVLGYKFWEKVHLFLQLLEPFVRVLIELNIDKTVMGDVYFWRFEALEAIRGHMLNPKYFGRSQTKDKSVIRGWKATLERYEYDNAARQILREQLSSYCRLEGSCGEEDAMDCRDKMDPVAWWENFGFEMPHLRTLAIKILSQVSSVAMCQETWIDDEFLRRQVDDILRVVKEYIVFVRNNLKLQCRRNGTNKYWYR